MTKAMRQPTLETLGLGPVIDIFRNGRKILFGINIKSLLGSSINRFFHRIAAFGYVHFKSIRNIF